MNRNNIPLGFGTLSKGWKVFLISFLGILIISILVVILLEQEKKSKLLKEGVRVSAIVKFKQEVVSGRRNHPNYSYYFDLDLYKESGDTNHLSNAKQANKNINEIIDALVADSKARMEGMNYKSYAQVRIPVYRESYTKYSIGDKVKAVHFKDNVESTRLLEDIE